MAPPTSNASTRGSRFSMTSSLPDTFAPPSTATKGRAGDASRAPRCSSSRSSSSPAAASATWATMPAVEEWARCAEPNASLT